jgi:glycosyltransferase involved in cell wall biosynthesis
MNLVFITHYQNLYGANKSLCNLLTGLDKDKYKILVLCPFKGEMSDYLDENQIPNISNLAFWGWEYRGIKDLLKFSYRFLRSLLTLLLIYPKLRNFKPDIVYSNSSVIWIGKAISILTGKPHIWHVREFGMKDYGLKMVGGRRFVRRMMNSSDAVIAISKAIESEVLHDVKMEVKYQIYNGVVKESDIAEPKKKSESGNAFTFCMAGLLIPAKGFEDALHALKIVLETFPQTKLRIAGEGQKKGTYEAYLHKLSCELGLDNNVEYMGFLNDVSGLYSSSDCLLMCSKAEGLGRVTIEAMANGLPVIGHDSGATSEIVKHNINGYLYKSDSRELASYMIKIQSDENYALLSKNATQTVRDHFTVENYIKSMEKLLQNINNGRE